MENQWLEEKIAELAKHSLALENAPAFAIMGLAKKAAICVAEVTQELARRELLRNE